MTRNIYFGSYYLDTTAEVFVSKKVVKGLNVVRKLLKTYVAFDWDSDVFVVKGNDCKRISPPNVLIRPTILLSPSFIKTLRSTELTYKLFLTRQGFVYEIKPFIKLTDLDLEEGFSWINNVGHVNIHPPPVIAETQMINDSNSKCTQTIDIECEHDQE